METEVTCNLSTAASRRENLVPMRSSLIPAALIALLGGILLANLQHDATNQTQEIAHFTSFYLDGKMSSVFQSRVFIRMVVGAVNALTGVERSEIHRFVQTLSAIGGLWFVFLFARRIAGAGEGIISQLLVLAWLPWSFLRFTYAVSYPWDLPALFFAGCGLHAIASRRFWQLALVIAIGTANKETTLYLIAGWAFVNWSKEWRQAVRTCGLAAIWITVYVACRAGRPGDDTTQGMVTGQFDYLLDNVQELFLLLRSSPYENIYLVGAIHLAAMVTWKRMPADLQRLYLATPLFLLPIFILGYIVEVRLFNDILPLGATATALWIRERIAAERLPASVGP